MPKKTPHPEQVAKWRNEARHKADREKDRTFEVTGQGAFPFDMLRYDECWPATNLDAINLDATEARTIRLASDRLPTRDRWESFGWPVKDKRKVRQ